MHVGYITWKQFEANQKPLAENAQGSGKHAGQVRPASGPALPQGRVLRGICGERMGVQYNIAYHRLTPTYVCQEASVRRGEKVCQRVPGAVVDPVSSTWILGSRG